LARKPATMPTIIHASMSTGYLLEWSTFKVARIEMKSICPFGRPTIHSPFRPRAPGYDACDGIAVEPATLDDRRNWTMDEDLEKRRPDEIDPDEVDDDTDDKADVDGAGDATPTDTDDEAAP